MVMETMTKRQVASAMKEHGIEGILTGRGSAWEVELASEEVKDAFFAKITRVGGYMTGYGAWVLRPGYQSKGDWNDRSSRHHY